VPRSDIWPLSGWPDILAAPDYTGNYTNDYFEQAVVNPTTISNVVATLSEDFYTSASPTEDELITLNNELASKFTPAAAEATTSLCSIFCWSIHSIWRSQKYERIEW